MYWPVILPHFKKQLKRYVKKYRHLKGAVIFVLENFNRKQHIHIGRSVYKIRLKTKDIQKGKSKSFRMLVFVVEADEYLVPVCIYYKGDREDIIKKEINDHLEAIIFELRMKNMLK